MAFSLNAIFYYLLKNSMILNSQLLISLFVNISKYLMKKQGIYDHKRPRKPPYQVKESNLDPEIIIGNRDLIREVSVRDDTIYGFLPMRLVEGYGVRISSGWGP